MRTFSFIVLVLSLVLAGCGGGGGTDGDTQPDGDTAADGDTASDGDTAVDGDTTVDGDTAVDGDTPDGDQEPPDGDWPVDGDHEWPPLPAGLTLSPLPGETEVPLAVVVTIRSDEELDLAAVAPTVGLGGGTEAEGRWLQTQDRKALHFFPIGLLLPDYHHEVSFSLDGTRYTYAFRTVAEPGPAAFSGTADGGRDGYLLTYTGIADPAGFASLLLGVMDDRVRLAAPLFIEHPEGIAGLLLSVQDPLDFDADQVVEVNHTAMPYRLAGEMRGSHFMVQGELLVKRPPSAGVTGGTAPIDFFYIGGRLVDPGTDARPHLDFTAGLYLADCRPMAELWPDLAVPLGLACDQQTAELFVLGQGRGDPIAVREISFAPVRLDGGTVTVSWQPGLDARWPELIPYQAIFELFKDGLPAGSSLDRPELVDPFPPFAQQGPNWFTFSEVSADLSGGTGRLEPGEYELRFSIGVHGLLTGFSVAR